MYEFDLLHFPLSITYSVLPEAILRKGYKLFSTNKVKVKNPFSEYLKFVNGMSAKKFIETSGNHLLLKWEYDDDVR